MSLSTDLTILPVLKADQNTQTDEKTTTPAPLSSAVAKVAEQQAALSKNSSSPASLHKRSISPVHETPKRAKTDVVGQQKESPVTITKTFSVAEEKDILDDFRKRISHKIPEGIKPQQELLFPVNLPQEVREF